MTNEEKILKMLNDNNGIITTKELSVNGIDRFYLSSKKCSKCGNLNDNLKLSDRTYNYDYCGLKLDSDFNAAINLKNCFYFFRIYVIKKILWAQFMLMWKWKKYKKMS